MYTLRSRTLILARSVRRAKYFPSYARFGRRYRADDVSFARILLHAWVAREYIWNVETLSSFIAIDFFRSPLRKDYVARWTFAKFRESLYKKHSCREYSKVDCLRRGRTAPMLSFVTAFRQYRDEEITELGFVDGLGWTLVGPLVAHCEFWYHNKQFQ